MQASLRQNAQVSSPRYTASKEDTVTILLYIAAGIVTVAGLGPFVSFRNPTVAKMAGWERVLVGISMIGGGVITIVLETWTPLLAGMVVAFLVYGFNRS